MSILQTQSGPVPIGADASKAILRRMRAGCDGYGRSEDPQAYLVRAVRWADSHDAPAPVATLRVRP